MIIRWSILIDLVRTGLVRIGLHRIGLVRISLHRIYLIRMTVSAPRSLVLQVGWFTIRSR